MNAWMNFSMIEIVADDSTADLQIGQQNYGC